MSAFFNSSVAIAVAERVRDDAIVVYPGWCSPSDVEVKDSGDGFPLFPAITVLRRTTPFMLG